MYGQVVLMADVGEVERHGQSAELVAPLVDDGPATSDDDLGEVVVQGYVVVAKGHRRLAVDDECRQCGDV